MQNRAESRVEQSFTEYGALEAHRSERRGEFLCVRIKSRDEENNTIECVGSDLSPQITGYSMLSFLHVTVDVDSCQST